MSRWSLTLRNGPRIERARFDTLPAAVDALESRIDELAPQARRQAIDVFKRRYDAVRQVVVRGEIAGPTRVLPRVRGGVDLRGDGSAAPNVGRQRRRLIEPRRGESAAEALRRTLDGAT